MSSFNRSSGLTIQLAMNTSTVFVNPLSANRVRRNLDHDFVVQYAASPKQSLCLAGVAHPGISCWAMFWLQADRDRGDERILQRGNISQGQPLHLFQQLFCPAYFPAAYYIFGPSSDYVRMASRPTAPSVGASNTSCANLQSAGRHGGGGPPGWFMLQTNSGTTKLFVLRVYVPYPFSTGTYTVVGGRRVGRPCDLTLFRFALNSASKLVCLAKSRGSSCLCVPRERSRTR